MVATIPAVIAVVLKVTISNKGNALQTYTRKEGGATKDSTTFRDEDEPLYLCARAFLSTSLSSFFIRIFSRDCSSHLIKAELDCIVLALIAVEQATC